jgi:hypothetical protein
MNVLRVEPAPNLFDWLYCSFDKELVESWNDGTLQYTGSGKASISIILEYLRYTKELSDKMSEVIVPAWIGNPVYHQVNWFGFPSLTYSKKSKAIMVYHQYGFPQDMDFLQAFSKERNLILIEDCAHTPQSLYSGKLCGSFGRFSIYSFSKFSFSFALGGLMSSDQDFCNYAMQKSTSSSALSRAAINSFKYIDEINLARKKPLIEEKIATARKGIFGLYGDSYRPSYRSIALWKSKRENEFLKRRELYSSFRDSLDRYGICNHLERNDVTPYVIPIDAPEKNLISIIQSLDKINIRTSINHFDFNRNLLKPNFKKTVLIPCHSQISDSKFSNMIDIIKSNLPR